MAISAVVVGLGKIGMSYDLRVDSHSTVFSHCKALALSERYRLVGGVDPDAEKRTVFETHFKAPSFVSLPRAVETLRPDLVVIATPTERHLGDLEQLLSIFRPRAILCEKPLAYDLRQAEQIVWSCERFEVPLFVNYIRRSDPGVLEVKQRIETLRIERPIKGTVWYSKGFIHNGSHFINLGENWLGRVKGFKVIYPGRDLGSYDFEPDVMVSFAHGSLVFLSTPTEHFSHGAIELIARNGRLRYDFGGRIIEWYSVQSDPALNSYTVINPTPEAIRSGLDAYQLHLFQQLAIAIEGGDAQICTGREALESLRTIDLIRGKRNAI